MNFCIYIFSRYIGRSEFPPRMVLWRFLRILPISTQFLCKYLLMFVEIKLIKKRIIFELKTDVSFAFEADDAVSKISSSMSAMLFAKILPRAQRAYTFDILKCMAAAGSAIVCDYMETALFAIVCDPRSSAIVCDHMETSLKEGGSF